MRKNYNSIELFDKIEKYQIENFFFKFTDFTLKFLRSFRRNLFSLKDWAQGKILNKQ